MMWMTNPIHLSSLNKPPLRNTSLLVSTTPFGCALFADIKVFLVFKSVQETNNLQYLAPDALNCTCTSEKGQNTQKRKQKIILYFKPKH